MGVVFQDPEDQLFLTSVAQDVAFGPANMGLDKEEIATRVQEVFGRGGHGGIRSNGRPTISRSARRSAWP